MKIDYKLIVLVLFFLGVACIGNAQRITIKNDYITIAELSKILEKNNHIALHSVDEFAQKAHFNLDLKNITIDSLLTYLDVNTILTFSNKNDTINVGLNTNDSKKNKVRGIILDQSGNPISDVWISDENSSQIAITSDDGFFYLPNSRIGDSLKIVSFGFEETYINTNSPFSSVNLKPKSNDLDEVQVLAYGQTTNKILNTGSSVKVTAKDLEKTATLDPIQALQGRVAGLNITPNSGLAGANSSITLRGTNSLGTASTSVADGISARNANTPLFIVDGVPFNNQSLSNVSTGGLGNNYEESPFKSLSPSSIASIEVLKDADATAIYGARGANGVILITTKKAKGKGLKFSLDAATGFQHIPKFIKMLNTSEYLSIRRQAFSNDSIIPDSASAPDLLSWDTTVNHNWQKEYFNKTARLNTVAFSLSGGNQENNFRVSANYGKQSTVYNSNSGIRTGSFMFNGSHSSINGKFNVSSMFNYSTDHNEVIPLTLNNFIGLPPNANLYNSDGSLNWAMNVNPVASLLNVVDNKTKSINSNINLSYNFLQNLSFRVNVGYNWMKLIENAKYPIEGQNPAYGSLGSVNKGINHNSVLNIEPQLNYYQYFGKNHITVLLGSTYMWSKTQMNTIYASGFKNDNDMNDINKAQSLQETKGEGTYKFLSGFARLSYDYDQKYVLNLTGRRDGSSRFGTNNRFGNFGSIGAAWNFSDEKFMQWLKPFISFGKLRSSYGITGSDNIGDYNYIIKNTLSGIQYQNEYGYYATNLYNPNYKWESTKKLDVGIELGLLKNRIYLIGDFYRNRTGNQLVAYSIPAFVGESSVTSNLGATVQNQGFEFTLRGDIIKSTKFSWTSNFNISFERNKLISFPGLSESS